MNMVMIIMVVALASIISWIWANLITKAHEECSDYKGEDLFGEDFDEKNEKSS